MANEPLENKTLEKVSKTTRFPKLENDKTI